MVVLIRRVWDWFHTHEGKKIFRYSMVSAISTVLSVAILVFVYGVLKWSEIPSTVFANSLATFPSYWLNRNWAWGKSGRSHFMKEVAPFWITSALGIAISILGAALARHVGTAEHFDHLDKTALVVGANIASFGVFWVLKLMLFNRLFHVQSLLEEIDERVDEEEQNQDAAVR
jgi:putative flippase GtrA